MMPALVERPPATYTRKAHMSKETSEWLNRGNILVGMGVEPWWSNAELLAKYAAEGKPSPLYSGPIPVEDVRSRLFDWKAESFPLYTVRPMVPGWYGPRVQVDGANYRLVNEPTFQAIGPTDKDDTFGVFKPGYNAGNHQYGAVLLDTTAHIIGEGLGIESAGMVKNRAVAWVTVSVPESISTPEGVEFRPRLLAASSFNGTIATTWKRVFGLAICDNTVEMALGEATGQVVKVKHTKNSGVRITSAKEALGIIDKMADAFMVRVAQLCMQPVSEAQWAAVLDTLVTMPPEPGIGATKAANKREKLDEMYRYDPRCRAWQGTAFGVFQTFNTFDQHESQMHGKVHREERNMSRVIGGTVAEHDEKVLDVLARVVV